MESDIKEIGRDKRKGDGEQRESNGPSQRMEVVHDESGNKKSKHRQDVRGENKPSERLSEQSSKNAGESYEESKPVTSQKSEPREKTVIPRGPLQEHVSIVAQVFFRKDAQDRQGLDVYPVG